MLEAVRAFEALPLVEFVQPNYIYRPDTVPNDGLFGLQWGLDTINAAQAWDITTGDPSIKIAVIDTGVDVHHPDLAAKITDAHDYVDGDTNPQDEIGHGTHVAGIAAASTNNAGFGRDIAGVSWHSPIVPLRVCYRNEQQETTCPSDLVTAAILGASHIDGVRVINISLAVRNDPELERAVKDAYDKGIMVVAGVGNSNDSALVFPAAYDHVIAVAATDSSDIKWDRSNYGRYIDLAAPGVNILSTIPGLTYYDYRSGTSMAAPFVSGLAALVYSALPASVRTPDRVERILKATAEDLGRTGWDMYYGWGRIDAYRAVFEASNPPRLDFRALLYTIGADHSAPITVRIRESGTNQLLHEGQATTDSDGRCSGLELPGIPSGDYNVIVKAPASISRRASGVHFTAGRSTPEVDFSNGGTTFLAGGDFNNDDKVNLLDLVRLIDAYLTDDPIVDMYDDGQVNSLDYAILATNWYKVGDDYANVYKQPSQASASQHDTESATLQLSPSSGTYNVGDEFDVQIDIDTNGETIRGAEAIIRYDPCALEVQSISDGTAFSSSGQAYPELGEIWVYSSGLDEFSGSGTLGTIRFRVVAGDTPSGLQFLFRPNDTTDSNLVKSDPLGDILGSVGDALFSLVGTPSRFSLTGTLTPSDDGYLTSMEIPVALDVGGACGDIIAKEVSFDVYYGSAWHLLEVDRNRYNGWSTLWHTAAITDQVVSLRAIVTDTNDFTTTVIAGNLTLDRVAPTSTLRVPAFLPIDGIFTVTWSGSDNLSGLASYDVYYKDGEEGAWVEWLSRTTETSAIFMGEQEHDYYFQIRARDIAGNVAAFSPEQMVAGNLSRVYLPLSLNNYLSAPDLVVEQITVNSDRVQVVVKNQGNVPVQPTEEFWVDVYIDPDPPPTGVGQTWDMLSSEGIVWGVTTDLLPLAPGEAITLTTGDAHYWADLSGFSGALPAGTPVYAQVDSANAYTTYGAVLENHEIAGGAYNNISGPVLSTSTIMGAELDRVKRLPVSSCHLPLRR